MLVPKQSPDLSERQRHELAARQIRTRFDRTVFVFGSHGIGFVPLERLSPGSARYLDASGFCTTSIISSNLDQVVVRIVQVESGRRASGSSLVPGTHVITDGMKRVAVGNFFFLQTCEGFVKVGARQGKRQMLISFCAPGRKLNREILTDSDYREWPILAFQFEPENADVKINAGSNFVDVKNYVIDRGHGLRCFRLEP